MGGPICFILTACDSDDCGDRGVDEGGVVRVVIVACLVETQTLSFSADISGEYQGDLHRL